MAMHVGLLELLSIVNWLLFDVKRGTDMLLPPIF